MSQQRDLSVENKGDMRYFLLSGRDVESNGSSAEQHDKVSLLEFNHFIISVTQLAFKMFITNTEPGSGICALTSSIPADHVYAEIKRKIARDDRI